MKNGQRRRQAQVQRICEATGAGITHGSQLVETDMAQRPDSGANPYGFTFCVCDATPSDV